GPMVFLIDAGGVRVRWQTGRDVDWTGLEPDHTLLEPLSRRGGRSLPLKAEDWNTVRLTHDGAAVEIYLNGTLIYDRKLDYAGGKQFSLYHNEAASSLPVRKVTVTGEWPESLTDEFRASPSMPLTAAESQPSPDAVSLDSIHFDPQLLRSNAMSIRRQVAGLDPSQRFKALARWVLPAGNETVRFDGFWMPTFASSAIQSDPAFALDDKAMLSSLPQLLCPLLDLIAMATDRQREQLMQRADAVSDAPLVRLQSIALRALLAMTMGQQKVAEAKLIELQECLSKPPHSQVPESTVWMETVTAAMAVARLPQSRVAAEWVAAVHERHGSDSSNRQRYALQSQLGWLDSQIQMWQASGTEDAMQPGSVSPHWISTSDLSAETCAAGRPPPRWGRTHLGLIQHTRGHDIDYLMLRYPLTGDYTFRADLRPNTTSQVQIGNEYIGTGRDLRTFELGLPRQPRQFRIVERAWDKPKHMTHFRSEVTPGEAKAFLSGRMVHRTQRTEQSSPWIALRSWWRRLGRFNDVCLSDPDTWQVADEVSMIHDAALSGWHSYNNAGIGPSSVWRVTGWEDASLEIVGQSASRLTGSYCERLLQYRRPLVEDGDFEFEFWHDDSDQHVTVMPAIGRMALRVSHDGVAEHWITDGRWDRTRIRPDNLAIDPKDQIAGSVEFNTNAWNLARISLVNQTVRLHINDVLVYQSDLPEGIGRKVGLAYFADQGMLRVRNPILRGDWLKAAASFSNDLADPRLESLNQTASKLVAKFEHQFGDPQRDETYFLDPSTKSSSWAPPPSEEGLWLSAVSPTKWLQKNIQARFAIQGDFDIEARFDDLQIGSPGINNNIALSVSLNDDFSRKLATRIGTSKRNGNEALGQLILTHPD
ncbi:MAG: DUF1583 domain-containing protein, partial [Planctomycetota bacterium]